MTTSTINTAVVIQIKKLRKKIGTPNWKEVNRMAQTGYQNSAKVTYVWRILTLVHIIHSINKIIMNNKQY